MTGYIQTPQWMSITEEKPGTTPVPMDSWLAVSIPSAHQALVSTLDMHLVDHEKDLGYCFYEFVELWMTLSVSSNLTEGLDPTWFVSVAAVVVVVASVVAVVVVADVSTFAECFFFFFFLLFYCLFV